MDFNDFGENLEDSANFLIEKLKELHPWDDEWSFDISIKLVPFYREQLEMMRNSLEMNDSHLRMDDFNNLIRFSSILSKDQIKLLFMEDLSNIPLIWEGKYLKDEERVDLLIQNNGRLRKVDSNLYLFFNHEEL
ncbi:MAG: hypothetical protein Q4P11_06695 [Methanobrevibacter sp.]|jgi:hypothetical protein|nr:hypothetical protein [Methanobrevibacter sp.]